MQRQTKINEFGFDDPARRTIEKELLEKYYEAMQIKWDEFFGK